MNNIILPQKQKVEIYLPPLAGAIEIQAPQLICLSNTESINPGTETDWVMGEGFFDGLLL